MPVSSGARMLEIVILVAVAQLDRFVLAGRCTAGHDRAPRRSAFQNHIGFHRRVSA